MSESNNKPSFIDALITLFQSLANFFRELVDLATLELRLAGKSLIWIVWLCLAAIFLLIAGWVSLIAALAVWLVSLHLSWLAALLIIAGVNLFLIIPIILLIKRAVYYLTFPATRKQLQIYEGKHYEKTQHDTATE